MAEIGELRVDDLSPREGDGVRRVFATPEIYRSGSIRLLVNGIAYPPDDEQFGWLESSATTIELFVAPRSGDSLAAIYQVSTEIFATGDVVGSQFPPAP